LDLLCKGKVHNTLFYPPDVAILSEYSPTFGTSTKGSYAMPEEAVPLDAVDLEAAVRKADDRDADCHAAL
jgi:hypothetical protein